MKRLSDSFNSMADEIEVQAAGSIPVVVLTSSQEQKDLVGSYHPGVNSYIVKPANFERIGTAVQELGLLLGLAQSAAQRGEIS